MSRRLLVLGFLLSTTAAPSPHSGQAYAQPVQQAKAADPVRKKVLTLADYGRWNRITGAALSSDGKWMTYTHTPNDGDATLFIKELDGSKLYTVPVGSGAQFSDDSRWVAYFISPASSGRSGGRGGAGRGNAPPQTPPTGGRQGGAADVAPNRTFELLDLTTGNKTTSAGIASFRFAAGSRWLALSANRPAGVTTGGVTVVVRDLADGGVEQSFGNVVEYQFDDAAHLIAYAVDAPDKLANGIYVYDLERNTSRAVVSGQYDFDNLAWRARSGDLVALRGDKKKGFVQRENALVVIRGIGGAATPSVTIHTLDKVDTVISEFSAPRWSRDGARVFFGVKEQDAEAEAGGDPKPNVDVWHWKDDDVQSVQVVQLNQLRRATTPAVLDVATNKSMLLGDRALRTATPTPNGKWAIGRVDTTYSGAVEWGGSKGDYYRIALATGTRTLIEKGLTRTMGVSPDSHWYLFLKDRQIRAYDIENDRTQTLAVPGVSFIDETDDYPYEKPIYGVAGWTRDGRVLLNHRFDIWAVPLDGSKATNLTGGVGSAEQIRFRIVNFAGNQGGGRGGNAAAATAADTGDAGIDMTQPLTLSAYGEWTKESGYYRLAPGGKPQPIIYEEKAIGGVSKAAKADRLIFTQQTAAEFPDYWVSTTSFSSPRKVTDANPIIAEFDWTPKRVLVDYRNTKGERLQGTLTLPANYEPGKKYPMLVYFYDRMSNTHNSFSMPVYDDRPHMSTYASDGYLVLQPDIVYETGKPGTSALDCISAAVKKVIELGYADPKRIGLQGHSWGGYQSSFILTQTDLFAAVVTGAPPTNLVSFYDETYPGSGTLQQGIMEVGQVRMGEGVTPWTHHELYESQSPIHHVRNIKTPFLILHGTADNAVDWHQGLEFYAAARRWGKQVILLSYPGEPHHLARKENQKDFQLRMKAFFDHYLKGTPAPTWMTDGVPQVKKER
jgi:dipeptidyl aminopeptidase/acylaminoacyl peptidase